MSEIRIGELVGLERSSRWGTRVRVVIGVDGDNIKVADYYGVYDTTLGCLNRSMPGFLETPYYPLQ